MKKIILLGFACCMAIVSYGQKTVDDSFNPLITGVPSLGIAPDAIGGGMGDIGISSIPTMNSQYWNSSKYAAMEGVGGLALSYTPWLSKIVHDINLAYLSGYYRIGEQAGTLSGSLRFFSLGTINLTDVNNTPIGIAKPYEMALDFGYSRKLAENFSMGVNLRFIASNLSIPNDENYKTGYGFSADINGFYSLPIELNSGTSKFNFGFNISNIGTKISYDGISSNFLPTNIGIGAGYIIPFDKYNRLAINLEANKLLVPSRKSKFATGFNKDSVNTWTMSDPQYSSIGIVDGMIKSFYDAPGGFKEEMQEINWSAGAEYAYNEQFFVRAGYHNESANKGNRKYFTVGAGFKWTAFRLDVGYVIGVVPSNPLDQTLRFTLTFDVNGLKELTDNK